MENKEHTDKFKLANFFIVTEQDLTLKKLHKLLYYSYVWDLVLNDKNEPTKLTPLYKRNFAATLKGVIDLDIQEKYKQYGQYGNGVIKESTDDTITCSHCLDILLQVHLAYGSFTDDQLVRINRQEFDWGRTVKLEPLEPTKELVPSDEELYQIYHEQAINSMLG